MDTQNKEIWKYLKSGRTLTSLEALKLFGCLRLSARIFNLREMGHRIKTRLIATKKGKHIGQYYI